MARHMGIYMGTHVLHHTIAYVVLRYAKGLLVYSQVIDWLISAWSAINFSEVSKILLTITLLNPKKAGP